MNYCSLDDAWGDNKISNQFQKYMNNKPCTEPVKLECPVSKIITEKFTENVENVENVKNVENVENVKIITCNEFINHIDKCKYCYNKLYYKFNVPRKNELIDNLHNIINNNKDMIVLILIGIFIVMFFKLVSNITK